MGKATAALTWRWVPPSSGRAIRYDVLPEFEVAISPEGPFPPLTWLENLSRVFDSVPQRTVGLAVAGDSEMESAHSDEMKCAHWIPFCGQHMAAKHRTVRTAIFIVRGVMSGNPFSGLTGV